MNGIEITDLKKTYPAKNANAAKTVFDGFSLTVRRPIALMGASGCGKTTLLRLICGLDKPDGGGIRFLSPPCISYVFQEDRLFPALTAEQNLLVVRRGRASAADREAAAALLRELGLSADEIVQPVSVFSGGMKRRVAIARALFYPHDILLLDEPFKGLDAENLARTAAVIRSRERDILTLLVTHDASDAAKSGIDDIVRL